MGCDELAPGESADLSRRRLWCPRLGGPFAQTSSAAADRTKGGSHLSAKGGGRVTTRMVEDRPDLERITSAGSLIELSANARGKRTWQS